VTLEDMRRRMPMMASSERAFCLKHPEIPPYFLNLFSEAAARPPAPHRIARLARLVPPGVPFLGARVWASVDARFKEALAPAFMRAWEES
jgi:hypothetical protein